MFFFLSHYLLFLSKLGGTELQSHVTLGAGGGCHRDKTQLQLICCALVQELGCLGILEGWKSGVRYGVSGKDLEVYGEE